LVIFVSAYTIQSGVQFCSLVSNAECPKTPASRVKGYAMTKVRDVNDGQVNIGTSLTQGKKRQPELKPLPPNRKS
jgi:hypothetical protein